MPAFSEVSVPQNIEHAWQAPRASHSLLIALDVVDDQVFAVGERGHVLKAAISDLSHWRQASAETQVLLNAVDMQDNQQGWAVGHDAVMLSTKDAGSSWQKRFQAIDLQQPLFDIWFRDLDNGIAIGAYGYYLSTSDAGSNWQTGQVNADHDFHLNSIADNGEGLLFIAAESGYVYRSEDYGKNWQTLNPPYEGSFFDVAAYGDTVVVVGLRGHAFISRDKGDNWAPLPTNTQATLTSVTRLQNGQLLMVGHTGIVLLGDETGSKVSVHRLPDRAAISDVVEVEANQLVLVSDHGVHVLDICSVFRMMAKGCQ